MCEGRKLIQIETSQHAKVGHNTSKRHFHADCEVAQQAVLLSAYDIILLLPSAGGSTVLRLSGGTTRVTKPQCKNQCRHLFFMNTKWFAEHLGSYHFLAHGGVW